MPTETNCPHCREALTVPDDPQGRLAKCAHCGGIFPLAEALANRSDPVSPAATLQSTAPGSREADGGDSPVRSPAASGDPAAVPAVERAPYGDVSTAAGPLPQGTPAAPSPTASAPVAATPVAVSYSQEPAPAGWHLRIPEGRSYGPVDRAKLDRWLQEGRIDADCSLRQGEQGPWIPAATLFPQLGPGPSSQPDVRRPASLPQTAYAPRPQSPAGHAPSAGAASNPQYAAGNLTAGAYNADAYAVGQPVRRTATSDSYAASSFGAPTNATGSPFRTTQVQSHRGEVVFLLGLFGLLLGCPVFSGAAWYLGGADLRAMNLGLMNTGGRGMTTFGYVLGIVVSCFWIVAVLIAMLVISVSILTQ